MFNVTVALVTLIEKLAEFSANVDELDSSARGEWADIEALCEQIAEQL